MFHNKTYIITLILSPLVSIIGGIGGTLNEAGEKALIESAFMNGVIALLK